METLLAILLAIALFGNWLWFVYFRAYHKEIKRQLRKSGYEKHASLYIARLEARLDEAQRVGLMNYSKNTGPLYHYNDDGSTVMLLEDRIEDLQKMIGKGAAGMELDHVQPVSKNVNRVEREQQIWKK